jgi:hypothetical protein
MERRLVLTSIAGALTAGCNGSPGTSGDENSTQPPEDTPVNSTDNASNDGRETAGRHVLVAHWVETAPDDVDPAQSDEPPVAGNEHLQDIFDRAVAQDKKKDSGGSDSDTARGEVVAEHIDATAADETSSDLEEYEHYSGDPYPGWYFEHNGTIVTVMLEEEM